MRLAVSLALAAFLGFAAISPSFTTGCSFRNEAVVASSAPIESFSGRVGVLSTTTPLPSTSPLPPTSTSTSTLDDTLDEEEEDEGKLVFETDEESARLGVEPFSFLAAEAMRELSGGEGGEGGGGEGGGSGSGDSGGGGGDGGGDSGGGPLPSALWHLDRIDQRSLPLDSNPFDPAKAGFPNKGKGVTIYVVDSGVSVGHDEFLSPSTSTSPSPSSSRASEGPDFSNSLKSSNSNSNNNTSGPLLQGDCDGHGTHVASLAAGRNAGIAPLSDVVSLRVLGCDGSGRASSLVRALRWVSAEGKRPAVVVLSLGGGNPSPSSSPSSSAKNAAAAEAIDAAALEAVRSGAVVVAAAGNNGADACEGSPGRAPEVITVGASDLPLKDKFPRFHGGEKGTEKDKGRSSSNNNKKASSGALAAILSEASTSSPGGGGGGGRRRRQLLLHRRSLHAEGGLEPLYPFSNTGRCITIFAPGADLLAACGGGGGGGEGSSGGGGETIGGLFSPRPTGKRCPDPSLPEALAWSSGTSMAAPLVAGAAALLLGERPTMTPGEVKAELVSRATEGALQLSSAGPGGGALPGTPNKLLYLGPV